MGGLYSRLREKYSFGGAGKTTAVAVASPLREELNLAGSPAPVVQFKSSAPMELQPPAAS